MIPFIRSFSELMAITESRDKQKHLQKNKEIDSSTVDSRQRKKYIRLINRKEVDLPNLPKKIRRKWLQNKDSVSRFINDLEYINKIPSTYDLTLLERQNVKNHQNVA